MPKDTFFNLPDEKRQFIVDRAVDEFAERGFEAASINRIVAAAGIAKGSFYQYFGDKEDLYGHVVDYAIVQRKLQISRDESVKLEELNLTQFIRVLFGAMMRAFADRPQLVKISIDFWRGISNPAQQRIYEKYRHLQDDYFQSFIVFEKARGEIDALVDDYVLGYMLSGVGNLIIRRAVEQGYESLTGEYEDYIGGIADKIGYILTNGIYGNTSQTRAQ